MNSPRLVTSDEAQAWLAESNGLLLDVRLASEFELAHISGAVNNCVFEVAFVDRLRGMAPDLSTPICVYGAGPESHESRFAVEKIVRAGYTNVSDYRDGLMGWRHSEGPLNETLSDARNQVVPLEGEKALNLSQSSIEWTGRNLGTRHWGTLGFEDGSIIFHSGVPASGSLVIDMSSISDQNIEDPSLREVLNDHLKSDDFFDVERFPQAQIEWADAEGIAGAHVGSANLRVNAFLTMRGVKKPIQFVAAAGPGGEGQWICQAHFDFDRTEWGVIYGSGRFFSNLGMHFVNDLITLQIKLVVG